MLSAEPRRYRTDEPQRSSGGPFGTLAKVVRSAQVLPFGIEPRVPIFGVLLCQGEVEREVGGLHGRHPLLPDSAKRSCAYWSHRFQHAVARTLGIHDHQGLLDQLAIEVEHVGWESMSPPPQTASAASRVQPPANTARRWNSVRSCAVEQVRSSNRSLLAASLGDAARPRCHTFNISKPVVQSLRYCVRPATTRTRAAASSRASGMPSRRRADFDHRSRIRLGQL